MNGVRGVPGPIGPPRSNCERTTYSVPRERVSVVTEEERAQLIALLGRCEAYPGEVRPE
ncbi:hypothetical protein [Streptomyces sp. WMMB303]|uniref:hypothetical protein n=1 Tax=Streptomyces sp. WMMB303 TaxID=3034154 RepID=UPI0023EBDFCF|nr:hypothetical protein [Streptomyces sp. WMMB303]MDF4250221.1 hypothetical protein [Streptomyces sp. WMMB303]